MSQSRAIPFDEFGSVGPVLHFAHANGYPPRAYTQLLNFLSRSFHVLAMHMRPLWQDSDPQAVSDWQFLASDLHDFLADRVQPPCFGIGHSMGANATLRLAIREPRQFKALVLIDPVLFPPGTSRTWDFFFRLGITPYIHPLVKSALRRRSSFQSREEMFGNYRTKPIFARLSDASLMDYVRSIACQQPDGSVCLCYPPAWEARIYAISLRADREIWHNLKNLTSPLCILRGELTDTFWEKTARRVKKLLPRTCVVSIPDSTHLLPLEKPIETGEKILEFLLQVQDTRHFKI